MTDDKLRLFRQQLQEALDTYHPDWDVRRRATWHPEFDEEWQKNRRFAVWVDTLRRWVRGENFPRERAFHEFLTKTDFPTMLQAELATLYASAKAVRQTTPSTLPDELPITVGTSPLHPAALFVGREDLLLHLTTDLAQGMTQLLVLTGEAGIGKTAAACRGLTLLADEDHPVAYFDASQPLPAFNPKFPQPTRDQWLNWASEAGQEPRWALWDNWQAQDEDWVGQLIEATPAWQWLITARHEPILPQPYQPIHLTGLAIGDGVLMLRILDANGVCGLRDASEHLLVQVVAKYGGSPQRLIELARYLEQNRLSRLEDLLEG